MKKLFPITIWIIAITSIAAPKKMSSGSNIGTSTKTITYGSDYLNNLYHRIINLESLEPSDEVNTLFSSLVNYTLDSDNKNTLNEAQMTRLQSVCSNAEYALEAHWSKKISASKCPEKMLKAFPYYGNYEKLTRLEWSNLLSCTQHDRPHVIFIGSGPLPLSAIILAQKHVARITILDIDKNACRLSKKLVQHLGLQHKISIEHGDAATYHGYHKYNVFIVAALAGTEHSIKENVLRNIRKQAPQHAQVLARSSYGLRRILYKPLDNTLYHIFRPILDVRPQDDIINSFVICEQK